MDKIAKAITGAVTAFGGAYGVAATDGSVTVQEWVTIAVAVIVAGLGVWAVPNVDKSQS